MTAVFAFVAGAVLWPPGWAYWLVVAPMLGDSGTVAVIYFLTMALGLAFTAITLFPLRAIVAGGGAAYLAGMVALTVTVTPAGWFQYVWYAALLGCFLGGACLCHLHTGRIRLPRYTKGA
jgi:hypothetical protein